MANALGVAGRGKLVVDGDKEVKRGRWTKSREDDGWWWWLADGGEHVVGFFVCCGFRSARLVSATGGRFRLGSMGLVDMPSLFIVVYIIAQCGHE